MSEPPPRPAMIGRDAELAVLRDAFEAGHAGSPRVIVIRGEAGIGKTRLLQEFRDEIIGGRSTPPVIVAVGQCVEVGTIGAPFTPIRRLLRELYDGVGDAAFREAARSPVVLATLGTLVPEVADAETHAAPGGDYVTEAVERIIENLSVDHHLVLVIEDLHWADAATLDLLKTLAVTLRGCHVTVIMTYRSDDVGRTHPLRPVLAELDRSRVVTGLEIRRLSREEVTELARSIALDAARSDLAAIAARSEGVPFFVEELVELDGADLPDTLRTIVLARYERLGDTAKDVVGMLSAGGVHVEHAMLEAIHDRDPGDLDAGLREALSANVIVAEGEGYTFRHALIHEVVHADLLPSVRSGLHRRYAAAVQDRVDRGDRAAAMTAAEHWLAARETERAFDATVTAREHALDSSALASAALLGERLLDLWPQIPRAADRLGFGSSRLAAEVAEQWTEVGDMDRTLRVARAGMAGADSSDPVGEGRLHLAAGRALGNSGRLAESSRECELAITVLEASSDPAAAAPLARATALRAINSSAEGDASESIETALDGAIAIAEESGDGDALAYCTLLRAWTAIDRGDLAAAHAMIARVVASPTASPSFRLNARNSEVDALVRLGRLNDAIASGLAAMRLAADVGAERGYGSYIAANVAEAMLAVGRAREALPLLRRAVELLTRSPAFASFAARLLVSYHAWNDEATAASAARAVDASIAAMSDEDPEERVGWAEVDTESALLEGQSAEDPDRRREVVEQALARSRVLDEADVLSWPGRHRRLLPAAAWAAADAATLSVASEALGTVAAAIAEALSTLPNDQAGAPFGALIAAEEARAHGGIAAAAPAWRGAVEMCARGRIPVRHLHYARFRLAEALVAGGDREEASAVLEQIVQEAPEQGCAVVARWARDLAARAGLPLTDAVAPPDAQRERAAASGVSSLTPRELQVLALVAEGLTNPQIGARLFISPKTASVHVSAILAKIGAANRAEAAALYSTAGSGRPARA